jgi:ABC-type transporter Mla subunit MlaD
MSAVTRDEFETVKELLAAAANYAAKANENLDRLTLEVRAIGSRVDLVTIAQAQSQQQIDHLTTTIVQLTQVQARTQAQLDSLSVKVDRMSERVDAFVFEAQRLLTGQANLISKLDVKVDRMSERVDAFVFEAQRLLTGQADRISKLEGISERLEGILAYLVPKEGQGE